MYGPPGTGKTLLARACAAQTDATFLKLAGPQLVQMFIGDGAKLVRDCFALAKEKAPAIIFIDELDAVGTKRFDSEKSGDREVQRTMLELLNQLDGFASDDRIKVLAATNRVDVLDPALLRSGRLDRKIEFPLPNEEARAQILKIHSRKMKVDPSVNWGELARSTDEFGGAMLKAVCVEAGMIALRMGKNKIGHEHYVDAITEVQAKKKEVSNIWDPHSPVGLLTCHSDCQLLRIIVELSVVGGGHRRCDHRQGHLCTITWHCALMIRRQSHVPDPRAVLKRLAYLLPTSFDVYAHSVPSYHAGHLRQSQDIKFPPSLLAPYALQSHFAFDMGLSLRGGFMLLCGRTERSPRDQGGIWPNPSRRT